MLVSTKPRASNSQGVQLGADAPGICIRRVVGSGGSSGSSGEQARHATYHPPATVCDPRAPEPPSIQRIVNQTSAVGGPAARRLRKSGIDRHRSSVSRNIRVIHSDDLAIQNDTLAADAPVGPPMALQPLGYFVDAF
jgi:hypothetical protein